MRGPRFVKPGMPVSVTSNCVPLLRGLRLVEHNRGATRVDHEAGELEDSRLPRGQRTLNRLNQFCRVGLHPRTEPSEDLAISTD
jgi:hypothetical protein